MDTVKLGSLEVSRFILGGNPFSGFSHQSDEMDREQLHYYTTERIKQTYREAEQAGVNTHVGRADHQICRVLMEYWDEGGTIQWIAQTCPEIGPPERGAQNGFRFGAKAVFVHGGHMDFLRLHGRLDEIPPVINLIHDHGLPAGVAGHTPEIFEWAEEHLNCDFYMCSYYNPVPRDKAPGNPGAKGDERFRAEDRDRMAAAIQLLSKPVIHYKIMAAGRNDPAEAFRYAASKMRAGDAVCVGVHTKDRPDEIAQDVRLLEESLRATAGAR
ncbi:MAG: hypothetical protein ACE149_03495 [Armatimonadota bacterium]